ncbi:MAG: hypothetical protein JKY19_07050 [Alcanivoracaceae bacterium]|nr:hypothetical protein [Alcanivoracaceae bacterium]
MSNSIKIPAWFYMVATVAVIWDAMGVWAYINTMTLSAAALAAMPFVEQEIHNATPAWANAAFAIAVFGGLIGSVLLLLKKSLALPVLIVSLLAILVQMYNAFFIMDSFAVFGPGGMIMPIMVIVIAVFLVWLAKSAKSKSWIN